MVMQRILRDFPDLGISHETYINATKGLTKTNLYIFIILYVCEKNVCLKSENKLAVTGVYVFTITLGTTRYLCRTRRAKQTMEAWNSEHELLRILSLKAHSKFGRVKTSVERINTWTLLELWGTPFIVLAARGRGPAGVFVPAKALSAAEDCCTIPPPTDQHPATNASRGISLRRQNNRLNPPSRW
jgi:hypothetical protein